LKWTEKLLGRQSSKDNNEITSDELISESNFNNSTPVKMMGDIPKGKYFNKKFISIVFICISAIVAFCLAYSFSADTTKPVEKAETTQIHDDTGNEPHLKNVPSTYKESYGKQQNIVPNPNDKTNVNNQQLPIPQYVTPQNYPQIPTQLSRSYNAPYPTPTPVYPQIPTQTTQTTQTAPAAPKSEYTDAQKSQIKFYSAPNEDSTKGTQLSAQPKK
jgi:hypothetical protein